MGRAPGTRIGPLQTFNRPTALGEALERSRVAAKLTFKELAEKSGVSRRTLLSITNAQPDKGGRVGHRTVHKLQRALGVELWKLQREIEAERAAPAKGAKNPRGNSAPHSGRQKVQPGSSLHRKRSLKVQRGSSRGRR